MKIELELTGEQREMLLAQLSARIQYFETDAEKCGNINRIMQCIPIIETLKYVQDMVLKA